MSLVKESSHSSHNSNITKIPDSFEKITFSQFIKDPNGMKPKSFRLENIIHIDVSGKYYIPIFEYERQLYPKKQS